MIDQWVRWHDNGEKASEINVDIGTELQDGLETFWYSNGQKDSECNFIQGKKEGLKTEWYSPAKRLVTNRPV